MLTQMILRSTDFVDPQILSSCVTDNVSACIDEVSAWMASNRLQLNQAKTEIIWCSSSRRQQIPSDSIRIGSTDVQPLRYFDSRPWGLYRPWGHTSQLLSERVSRLYVKSGACGDLCHLTPCWLWFVLCQQGGLLQLSPRWYIVSAARPAAVRIECRRPSGFLSKAVRTHNPIASWASLAESSGAGHLPAMRSGIPLPSWNSAVLLRAFSGHLTSTLAAVCVLQTQPRWSYLLPDNARRPYVPFQWLHVHGTVCHHPSGMRRRWCRSVVIWRLYFFGRRSIFIRRS